jgi:hypothetical protein
MFDRKIVRGRSKFRSVDHHPFLSIQWRKQAGYARQLKMCECERALARCAVISSRTVREVRNRSCRQDFLDREKA